VTLSVADFDASYVGKCFINVNQSKDWIEIVGNGYGETVTFTACPPSTSDSVSMVPSLVCNQFWSRDWVLYIDFGSSGLSPWAIFGIVFASVVFVSGVTFVGIKCWRDRKRRQQRETLQLALNHDA